MQSSTLHHANAIVEKVQDSVETAVEAAVENSMRRHVANATFATNHNNGTINNNANLPPALQHLPPGYTLEEICPPIRDHHANATTKVPEWQQAMKTFFDKMDSRLQAQERTLRDITNNGNNANGGNGGGGGYRKRKNTSKYCWSHGACAHDSRSCNNKKAGHKDGATFSNKMGGSTRFCNPQE